MNRRPLPILCLLLLLPGGCGHLATRDEKEASFAPFMDAHVGRRSLRDFVEVRTAVLIGGAEPVAVELRSGEVGVRLRPTEPDGKVDVGSAAAISGDGYYLTAAHCCGRSPIFLVIPTPAGPEAYLARVCWRPPANFPQCDVALVKINATPPAAFNIEDFPPIVLGESVVTSGSNGEAGGRLLRDISLPGLPADDIPPLHALFHDAPLTHGDSGGPLTTTDGKLIGIEVLVRGVYFGPRISVALWPNIAWLDHIVASDRRREEAVVSLPRTR